MEFAKLVHDVSEDEDIPTVERARVIFGWLRLRGFNSNDLILILISVKTEVFIILKTILA